MFLEAIVPSRLSKKSPIVFGAVIGLLVGWSPIPLSYQMVKPALALGNFIDFVIPRK
jgi:sulfite exporter TauE/SafE